MLVGHNYTPLIDDEARPDAAASRYLHDASLNTFDDLRERRFALVGEFGGTNKANIEL